MDTYIYKINVIYTYITSKPTTTATTNKSVMQNKDRLNYC